MKKILILLIFILLLQNAYAQDIQVIKESRDTINLGDQIEIRIIFNNPHNHATDFEVKEILPQGVTLIKPDKADSFEIHDGLLTKVYRWRIRLDKGEIASITYIIKPNYLGEYGIKPTVVTDKLENKEYNGNAIRFFVFCSPNNLCEQNENSLNCPLDCKKGFKDNICDYKFDNTCDPDCEEDPDCGLINTNPILIIGLILLIIIIVSLIAKFVKRTSY